MPWKPRYSLMPDIWLVCMFYKGEFIPWEVLHRIGLFTGALGKMPPYEEAYNPADYPAGWQFEWKFY